MLDSQNRSESGRFQSGVSGNPGGRPKGLVNRKIFQYYREALKFVRPIRVSSAETGSNFDRPPKNDR